MRITDFEPDIEEKILARGRKYFADGSVANLWAQSPGFYSAVVEGSIPYDVEIRIGASGEILRHSCDCPYDWGEYCKHKVAVLFAIRSHLKLGTVLKQQGQKRGLRTLLSEKTKDELVNLLCDLAIEHNLREDIFYLLEQDDNEP